jgi:hypothetical protein
MKTGLIILGIILVSILIVIVFPDKKKNKPQGTGVAQPEVKEPKTKEGDVAQ